MQRRRGVSAAVFGVMTVTIRTLHPEPGRVEPRYARYDLAARAPAARPEDFT